MMEQSSAQLRDIKPLVEIADSSFYFYWGVIVLGALTACGIGYYFYQRFQRTKRVNLEKEYLTILNDIEWSSPKKAAYRATQYGRLLATDERRNALFSHLLPLLERYKYRKETDTADEETISQFELYRRVCNESV